MNELSASHWIGKNRLNLPEYTYPVPLVGDTIQLIERRYMVHSAKIVEVKKNKQDIVYVKSMTKHLIVCEDRQLGYLRTRCLQVSEFRTGKLIFRKLYDENSISVVAERIS